MRIIEKMNAKKCEGSRIYRKRQPVAKPIRRQRTRKSSRILEKVLDALMTEPVIRTKVNKQCGILELTKGDKVI